MHLTGIKPLDRQIIESVYQMADKLKREPQKWCNLLEGKTFVLFFPESSLRTRVTFEKGIACLGGKTILFPPSTLDKKEAMKDVLGYLENWIDAVIVRHASQEKIEAMAAESKIPIINAMSSSCHPCEILSDLFALRELSPNYLQFTYAFIGENANILKSWVEAAEVLGFRLNHVFFEEERVKADDATYHFTTDIESVLSETDVFLTDPIPEADRTAAYYDQYQLKMLHLNKGKPSAFVNPCPPFYRDAEIEAAVIDSKHFVGYGFKENLIYVQQALILKCLGIEI